jgi:hypothetical protein
MEVAHEERSKEPHILAMRGRKAITITKAIYIMAIEENQMGRVLCGIEGSNEIRGRTNWPILFYSAL